MHSFVRNVIASFGAIAIAGGCGGSTDLPEGEDASASVSAALVLDPNASTTYVYLRSISTGWGADASSLMTKVATGIWTKTFNVTESWMVANSAPVIFTLTNQRNGWGTRSTFLTDRGHPWQTPQATTCQPAPLAEINQNFSIKFPALGQYTVTFYTDALSYTFRAASATCPNPGCAARLAAGQTCVVDNFQMGAGAWTTEQRNPGASLFSTPSGRIAIDSRTENDAMWKRTIGLLPGAAYTLMGWQRGEDITGFKVEENSPPAVRGATLGVLSPDTTAFWEMIACPPLPAPEDGSCAGMGSFAGGEVRLTFIADPTASATIAARLGGPAWPGSMNLVKGRAFFDDISIRRLGSVLSNQQRVQLFYETADLSFASEATLKAFVDRLDVVYRVYADLAGGVPFGGTTQNILSVAHTIQAVARSGNPITWQRVHLQGGFASMQRENDWSFAMLHELGHNFLLTDRFVWEGEEWANMMIFLALDRLDDPGNPYNPPGVFRFYWEGWQTSAVGLRDAVAAARVPGEVRGADFTFRLMDIAIDVGGQCFTDTFRYFQTISEDRFWTELEAYRQQDHDHDGQLDSEAVGKLHYFMDKLSAAVQTRLGRPGYSAIAQFTPDELDYFYRTFR
jgi:hypothetical protein